MPDGTATAHTYRPSSLAIVALPLSMAMAAASGVSPERELAAALAVVDRLRRTTTE